MVLFISGVARVTAHPPDRTGWLFIAGSAVLLVLWVVVEKRGKAPSFPVGLFRSGSFVAAVVVGIAGPVAVSATALALSDAVQYVRQASSFTATLWLEPFYVAGGVGGLVAGRLLSNGVTERKVMTVGSLLAAAGFLLLIPAGPDSSPWLYLPGIVVAGAGIFSAMTAQGQVFVKAVSDQAYGAVTSSKTTVSQLGSALGMVFTMLFLKVFMGLDLYRDLKAAGATEEDVRATVSTLQAAAETGGTDLSAFPAAVKHGLDSMSTALSGVMLLSAAVMLAAAAAVWLLMRERRGR